MGMNLAEKILARAAGRDEVVPGDFVWARVDLALANDLSGALAIREFHRMGADRVFDRDKIVLVPDHYVPNKDILAASQAKLLRDFARQQQITHYFEVGRMGIEHALLPEEGLVGPGQLVVGADSHTCTYGALGAFATGVGSTDLAAVMATGQVWLKVPETFRFTYHGSLPPWVGGKDLILFTIGQIGTDGATYLAMEFAGETIAGLPVNARLTICNMAVEAGAMTGIIAPDATTIAYLTGRFQGPLQVPVADADARPARTFQWDVSSLEPQVACPASPGNVRPVSQVAGVPVDQVVIGSCTNGYLEDLQVAAAILRGRKIRSDIRLIVIPATQRVYLEALRTGLLEVFVTSGAAVSTPTCGPCAGCHMGVLAEGERALATTNRNFVGRMGHPTSEVYLAGPAVAAATAIKGCIAHPEEVLS
ncbi:MAG TPA: 3-isopropylmalate dehydratase large subunit [Bacillota bacterium]|nr:3-isopropylmalate dehydratase large subunit [Bacillota bacterium]